MWLHDYISHMQVCVAGMINAYINTIYIIAQPEGMPINKTFILGGHI